MRTWVQFLGGLFAFLLFSDAASAAVNDLFASRTVLVGTNVTIAGNNSGTGTEPGEDTGGGAILRFYSVWYSWTAPTNGVLHLSGTTTVWNFYLSLRAFRGTAVNALTLSPTTPDGGIPVTTGDTVAIQVASIYYPVWGGGGGTGPFTLNLALEVPSPPSPNDNFNDRLDIAGPVYHFTGTLHGATSETGEPLPAGTTQTLWWKFTAGEAGLLGVWPTSPQFTPSVALYVGTNLTALSPVPAVKGLRYMVQAGHDYALQLASGPVPVGTFDLEVRFFSLTNNWFAGSTHLEGTNFTYIGNLTTATFEPGEPDPGYTNTIWASWAAPATGRARYTHPVVDWYQPVRLYQGPTLGQLRPVRVVGLGNSRYDFLAEAGEVYHFQISGGVDADECALTLELFEWATATNDFFATARQVAGQHFNSAPFEEWFAISDATTELGEPAHLGSVPAKSLWWKWTAPVHGVAYFSAGNSLATNVLLAAYQGNTVEALALLGKANNTLSLGVTGGDTYYLAGVVPASAMGDIILSGGINSPSSGSRAVPGNLLREPSWEGTAILEAVYWGMSGGIGGAVGEPGGADGVTWPTFSTGGQVWQDFVTVSGRVHAVRFAIRAHSDYTGSTSGDGRVRVLWDGQEIGVGVLPAAEVGFWHWVEFTAVAHFPTSRVSFVNLARNVELDAFSVVALTEPPQVVSQPTSTSVLSGGTAAFVVGVTGSAPLTYQWFFNDAPYTVSSGPVLVLENVTTNQAGLYRAVITNAYGAALSATVQLVVETATTPIILWQPYGDTIGVGGAFLFSVVAGGSPPLSYQWFKGAQAIAGATNRTLGFPAVDYADAGGYSVRVQNHAGTVWSLVANLMITNAIDGGGIINFANRYFMPPATDAPVYDLDGFTRLNRSNYLAQLYGGPSLELLRPVGQPTPFQSGFNAGYFRPQLVVLPTVAPGENALVQVRAWDGDAGSTYEEARALGGRFGKSELFTATAGGGPWLPGELRQLQSFNLQAGRPQFATGRIVFVERQPGGIVVWSHHGEPGFRYLIERSFRGLEWNPFLVVTNITSEVTFTDSANSASPVVMYRSRILD